MNQIKFLHVIEVIVNINRFTNYSSVAMAPMDEIEPDPYDELDTIAPLPLYSLFAADNASTVYQRTEDLDQNNTQTYDNLFNGQESDDDLDDMLDDIVQVIPLRNGNVFMTI